MHFWREHQKQWCVLRGAARPGVPQPRNRPFPQGALPPRGVCVSVRWGTRSAAERELREGGVGGVSRGEVPVVSGRSGGHQQGRSRADPSPLCLASLLRLLSPFCKFLRACASVSLGSGTQYHRLGSAGTPETTLGFNDSPDELTVSARLLYSALVHHGGRIHKISKSKKLMGQRPGEARRLAVLSQWGPILSPETWGDTRQASCQPGMHP